MNQIQPSFFANLACPCCKEATLKVIGDRIDCSNPECGASFPLIGNKPILINEANSLFSINDYQQGHVTTMDLREESEKPQSLGTRLKKLIRGITPPNSRSVSDFPVDAALETICAEVPGRPKVLVVGAGDAEMSLQGQADLVFSDVALGPLTDLVCDAHDIPFADESFDAVISVAVLEHVLDPVRCVAEMTRVIRPDGFVYSVTPFMQQVHMGRYDFQRFSHLAHRRLFRHFGEERSGVANAQGMVLAWSLERFLSGFSENPATYSALRTLARFIAFPFLLFDPYLARKKPAFDSASGYYFFGRKKDKPITDREIVAGYRGIQA